jgi:hypothetical protein
MISQLKKISRNCSLSISFLAVVAIPMQKEKWVELKFNKIPNNFVEDTTEGMKVTVMSSASPLIYKMEKPILVQGFSADLDVTGNLKKGIVQNAFGEDSVFRLGLVAIGDRKLGWFQSKVAADWVLKLFTLAPENTGLDKIYFYNLGRDGQKTGTARQHPKSELMYEQIVATRKPDEKTLHVEYKLNKALPVTALWLSIDGDDSKSSFTNVIKKIELMSEEAIPTHQ